MNYGIDLFSTVVHFPHAEREGGADDGDQEDEDGPLGSGETDRLVHSNSYSTYMLPVLELPPIVNKLTKFFNY